MATDYILFIHGVSVRDTITSPAYADELFSLINQKVQPNLTVKPVPLYWGNASQAPLNELIVALKASPVWNQLWFKEFRLEQILPFVGDAALYISRHFGSFAVEQLKEQAERGLANANFNEDRLHIVGHSWGSIVLFDVLFASRWEQEDIPAYDSVQKIRSKFFGLSPDSNQGIRLASVHTMGSPLALFSLITIIGRNNNMSSHDISPKLKTLIRELGESGITLPWQNFIHPGDPIAWPLDQVIPKILDAEERYIKINDILTSGSGALDWVGGLFRGNFVSLVNGGSAHGSYWENQTVANKIAETILQTAR